MKRTALAAATIATVCLTGVLLADDWPQWRGPTRDGISKETGLMKEWPAGGPRQLWQSKEVGGGYSTPAVVGGRVFVMGNSGTDNEFVLALNVSDGTQAWKTRVGDVGKPDQQPPYPGSRSTPTVDGEVLYALGSDGDLVCLDVASGNPRWQKNIRTEFKGDSGKWAYSESPLVDGDAVVVSPGGAEATIVALNKKSGEVIWKSAVPGGDPAGYASAIIAEAGGVKQYVQFLGKGLVGVDAKTGAFLWRSDQAAKGSPANIPTPIVRDGHVYNSAHSTGGGLLELTADGGKISPKQVYFDAKLPRAIGGAVLVGDHLYGATQQMFVCADFKTGKILWSDRAIGAASVVYADGNLYLHGENGEVALVEATPDAYKEKGRFTPAGAPERGRSKAWAYPVIADGKLYIRDVGALWCYDIKGQ